MSATNDRNYHEGRAREESLLADQAANPSIAAVHRQLAALHRRRMVEIVHLGEPQIKPMPLIGSRPLRPDIR